MDTNSPNPINPATPTPAPTPTAPVSPSISESVEQITASETGLTSDQISTMVEWARADLKAGKITQAQFDQQAEELNLPAEQRGPDTRSDEVKELDLHFPPAKPEDYTIFYGTDTLSPEQKHVDSTIRAWVSGAQFPRNLGNSLIHAVEEVSRQTARMTDAQQEEFAHREFAKLQHIHGPQLEAKLAQAAKMVGELEGKRPGLRAFMKQQAIFDSARVVTLLLDQSDRYWRRRKG